MVLRNGEATGEVVLSFFRLFDGSVTLRLFAYHVFFLTHFCHANWIEYKIRTINDLRGSPMSDSLDLAAIQKLLQDGFAAVDIQFAAVNNQIATLRSDMEAQFVELNGRIETLQTRFEFLGEKVDEAEFRHRTFSRIGVFQNSSNPLSPYQGDIAAPTGTAFSERHASNRIPSPVAQ